MGCSSLPSFLLPSSEGKQSQLLRKPTEVELGLQVGVEFNKNDVLKKVLFLVLIDSKQFRMWPKKLILLNLSGYKYARRLGHISYERWDPKIHLEYKTFSV